MVLACSMPRAQAQIRFCSHKPLGKQQLDGCHCQASWIVQLRTSRCLEVERKCPSEERARRRPEIPMPASTALTTQTEMKPAADDSETAQQPILQMSAVMAEFCKGIFELAETENRKSLQLPSACALMDFSCVPASASADLHQQPSAWSGVLSTVNFCRTMSCLAINGLPKGCKHACLSTTEAM